MSLFAQMHPQWQEALRNFQPQFELIDRRLDPESVTPHHDCIMRAFATPLTEIKVVIIGQDPYPGLGHAQGLAFSVATEKLPSSLRNIFKELQNDLGGELRSNGDLSDWQEQGVFLLNRILTTQIGISLAHEDIGWQEITNEAARILGNKPVVAILWGKAAQELRSFFKGQAVIESVHPSPLSAYRGFFGSKPFSQANSFLESLGRSPINWA
jgi:uracil-DNA glycosylase